MKKRFVLNIMIAVAGLVVLTYAIGCGSSGLVDDKLDLAEVLMEERPDSALDVLSGIDKSDLRGNRIKARFSLLKSMALDRNYITIVNLEILQPAIDYYISKNRGNSDERIRTYYYKGRIHRNAGNDDLAMQSYLTGLDNLNHISDSLTLARMLVAQATLYYKQYQINDFVENNLRAAEIYGRLDKPSQRLKSYLRALTGEIILGNKHRADSIVILCNVIVNDSSSLKRVTLLPFLKYTVNFGADEEVRNMIEEVRKADMQDEMNMTLARAYLKIGEPETGLKYLEEAEIGPDNILDSLTYWSVKTEILENLGEDGKALDAFRNYSRVLEEYHTNLFSNELLFSEKKHEMEMESVAKIRKRDSIIKSILVGIMFLICVIGIVYYRYRINLAARLIAEQKARQLKLESEKIQLEKDNMQLETDNMRLRIDHLEDERERLAELVKRRDDFSAETRRIVRRRLEMLDGLLAKEITNEEGYAKQFRKYAETIRKDRKLFLQSLRKDLSATYPAFFANLESHGLTERETDYVCLYAIGLRGKEIGNYLELVRHYNISSEVRRKLGLDSRGSNLGPFIQDMLRRE